MAPKQKIFNAITIFLLCWFSKPGTATLCEVSYSIQGQVLKNHIITSQPARRIDDCVLQCMDHPRCHSSNFYQDKRMCDLNDASHLSHPEDMTETLLTNYNENIMRPFPCNNDSDCGKYSTCSSSFECKECRDNALGMEDRLIPDSSVTASSIWGSGHEPWRARLHNSASGHTGSWSSRLLQSGVWLQIELGVRRLVTKVATQGRPYAHDQWVTSYKISFSMDNTNWEEYKESDPIKVFSGNSDRDTVVSHNIKIRARYVRFVVVAWHNHISMRVELYGCPLL